MICAIRMNTEFLITTAKHSNKYSHNDAILQLKNYFQKVHLT